MKKEGSMDDDDEDDKNKPKKNVHRKGRRIQNIKFMMIKNIA